MVNDMETVVISGTEGLGSGQVFCGKVVGSV